MGLGGDAANTVRRQWGGGVGVGEAEGRLREAWERARRSGGVLFLDELPELWTVLRGEMSLVGPRPLPCDYTPLFSETEARRLWVRPGLFGLAQAAGRNALPWGRRLAFDVQYADQKPEFVTDFRIVLTCCALLLRGRGATMPGHSTSPSLKEILPRGAVLVRAPPMTRGHQG